MKNSENLDANELIEAPLNQFVFSFCFIPTYT